MVTILCLVCRGVCRCHSAPEAAVLPDWILKDPPPRPVFPTFPDILGQALLPQVQPKWFENSMPQDLLERAGHVLRFGDPNWGIPRNYADPEYSKQTSARIQEFVGKVREFVRSIPREAMEAHELRAIDRAVALTEEVENLYRHEPSLGFLLVLAEDRNSLESKLSIFREVGMGDRLASQLQQVDEGAHKFHIQEMLSESVAHPLLAEVSWREPDAWWGIVPPVEDAAP